MGMEKYQTGFQAGKGVEGSSRELPQIDIAGTLFVADIEKLEFREAANPANRMPMLGLKEEMGFSHFFYDVKTKNHFAGATDTAAGIPDHVRIILLPPLKDLDPVGHARRSGLSQGDASTSKRQLALTAFSKQSQTAMPVKRKSQRL